MNILIWQLILQLVLIALNALFAAAEIAIITIHESKLSLLITKGDKRAVKLGKLSKQPSKFLATIQVCITLAGFLGSAFAADNFSDILVKWLVSTGIGIPATTLDTIAVIFITLILSYFTLVFGELVPKRVAMRNAEKLALALASLIYIVSKIFAPLVWLLTVSTNGILRLFKIDPHAETESLSEEELRLMLETVSAKGIIDKSENEMIQNIFEFDDKTAEDVMVHRTDMDILYTADFDTWMDSIVKTKHSFYPVCEGNPDSINKILNTKEYLLLSDKSKNNVIKRAIKPAYFVPETVRTDVLFHNMKTNRKHFAIVLDDFGGVSGIITMHDLLMQLVGNINDEDTIEDNPVIIEKLAENQWKISGSVSLKVIKKELGVDLPVEEYETFSGFCFGLLGYVPDDGETPLLEEYGLKIQVLEIKDHYLEFANVSRTQTEKEETELPK
ncbi:MAG: hemolysin family protein [Clostridia bacterium]|nr:hemolysin family protein [Clostridia bacterium]